MRLHPLAIVLSIPAVFLACSSGGVGTVNLSADPSAYGQSGANVPALSPIGTVSGGQTPEPEPRDTGTQIQDTGTVVQDTGTRQDTSTGDLCSTPSKCSDPVIDPSACSSAIADPTCGSQARTYIACLQTKQVCDSTGKTDLSATGAACSSEAAAYSACTGA